MEWFLYNTRTNGLLGLDCISVGYIRLLVMLFGDKLEIFRYFRIFKHEWIDWTCWHMTKEIYIIYANKPECIYKAIEKIFEYEKEHNGGIYHE